MAHAWNVKQLEEKQLKTKTLYCKTAFLNLNKHVIL